MSTKIYTGIKINVKSDELLRFLKNLDFKIKNNIIIPELSKLFYEQEYFYKSLYLFGLGDIFDNFLKQEYIKFNKEYFSYSLSLIVKNNYSLAIVFSDDRNIFNFILEQDDVQFYGYWDNTDKDSRCSDKEWNQRRKDWEYLSYGEPLVHETLTWEPFYCYYFHPTPYKLYNENFIQDIKRIYSIRRHAAKLVLTSFLFKKNQKEYQFDDCWYQIFKTINRCDYNRVLRRIEMLLPFNILKLGYRQKYPYEYLDNIIKRYRLYSFFDYYNENKFSRFNTIINKNSDIKIEIKPKIIKKDEKQSF